MKDVVVVYKSKYGHTKQYAEWIAEALECDLFEASSTDLKSLLKYDCIVYGGGLYASGIDGIGLITKNFEKLKPRKISVFTVGLADPGIKEQFIPIIEKNFTAEMRDDIKIFHLRGGIDYKHLGLVHKSMMAMLKKMIEKKKDDEKTEEDKEILKTYGGVVDFTDKTAIDPILNYIGTAR